MISLTPRRPRSAKERPSVVCLSDDGDHVRMPIDRCDEGCVAEGSELQCECLELLNGEFLIAKGENHVLGECRFDRGGGRTVERLAQVDAMHIGAEAACDGPNIEIRRLLYSRHVWLPKTRVKLSA